MQPSPSIGLIRTYSFLFVFIRNQTKNVHVDMIHNMMFRQHEIYFYPYHHLDPLVLIYHNTNVYSEANCI